MQLRSDSFADGQPLGPHLALGKPDIVNRAVFSDNLNPHLQWSDPPVGTRSFVVITVDHDAPSVADDVNQPDRTIARDLPRASFYHWVLFDIPASVREIAEGSHANGLVARGKDALPEQHQMRHGMNSYTGWFAGDPELEGEYFGYDGPFPPWNDERTHQYEFTLYALDVPRLDVAEPADAESVLAAMRGHVLDQCSLFGTYRIAAEAGSF